MTELSNYLSDLAERVREANAAVVVAERTTAEKALEAGRLLCEAKDKTAHGEWTPFLERAGVHERQARRLMQLARSGLNSGHVSDLGGIKAALAFLACGKLPNSGQHVIAFVDEKPAGFVWPSTQHPGFYHVGGVYLVDDPEPSYAFSTHRPMRGGPLVTDEGVSDPVWDFLPGELRGRVTRFETVEQPIDFKTVGIFGGSHDGAVEARA